MDLFWNELEDPQEMRSVKRGFVATDPDLVKAFLSNNREEVPNHLFW
jgi:hypothetical protein